MRLGLVLAQIGEKSDIKISDDEVTQALIERVRQYPGQERQVDWRWQCAPLEEWDGLNPADPG